MKKILCLTSHDLNAPDYGAVLRARKTFQMLSRFGNVSVILAGHHKEVIENAKSPQAGFALLDKVYFPASQYSMARRLRAKLNPRFLDIGGRQAAPAERERLLNMMTQFDLIWVHGLETANGFGIWHWPKSVLDVDDIPSSLHRQRFSESATTSGKCWECKQTILWRRNERYLAERFDAVCVCSQLDRNKLKTNDKLFVLPNGFDAPQTATRRNPFTPPRIGFVGTFKYPPNREGVRWFVDNVWPLILNKFPDARLRLAGESGKKFFSGQSIDVLDWVSDMENEMAGWSMAIVPVRVGGGTRIKILEAFSRKCPLVSTSLGAYGHDVRDGHELLLADSPKAFAARCLRLLEDPAKGQRLAENAWIRFLQKGTWEAQTGRVAQIIRKIWNNTIPVETRDVTFDVQIHSKTVETRDNRTCGVQINTPVPAVSVVIPAFNRANYVAHAVESVLAQTFKDLEIIAIDDGSSDGTSEVLKKFGNKVHLIHQKNRGVSSARNAGIRAARGNWLAFLDSDDRWHPEKLERQLQALRKYSGKICFTRSVNHQNKPFRDIEFISSSPHEPEVFSVQDAVDAVCLSPRHPMIQTMVAEKKLLMEAGLFDESFHAAEDAELIFRLSFLSGFLYIDRPLATVFENSANSLTYSEELGSLARRNQSYLRLQSQMYWRLAETSPEKISVLRKRLGYFISRRAEIACAAGELSVARTLAQNGIFYAGNFRDFARCVGVLLLPNLVRTRAQKKWPV